MSTVSDTRSTGSLQAATGGRRRLTLDHIAGLGAGGSLELGPGHWDFGSALQGTDRLRFGDPTDIDFTLIVEEGFDVFVEPVSSRVRLDDEPVRSRALVGNRTIGAGASRFALRWAGPVRRSAPPVEGEALHPWVTDPAPEPIYGSRGGFSVDDMIELRRRLHPGVVDIGGSVAGDGGALWYRRPGDRQFGLTKVGVADVAVEVTRRAGGFNRGPLVAVPISVDLLSAPTVVIGSRRQQLALVAQMVLNGAATTHPDHLQFGLDSDRPDLDFIRDLPHWAGAVLGRETSVPRSVLVVDRTGTSVDHRRARWPKPTAGGSLLVLGRRGDPIPPIANVLTIGSGGSMAVHTPVAITDSVRMITGVTPTGISPLMARELTDRLARFPLG